MLAAFPKREKLPAETQAQLHRLEELSSRAQTGDAKARKELRDALESAPPQLIAEAADFMKSAQRIVIRTITEKDSLMRETLPLRLEAMRAEIAGENPGALEALLAERIVSLWLVSEVLDALNSAYFHRGENRPRVSTSYMQFVFKWQESVNRRLLNSIKTLGHLRRLQNGIPEKQTNVQINLGGGGREGP